MKTCAIFIIGASCYVIALGAVFLPSRCGMTRTDIAVTVGDGHSSAGTVWHSEVAPRAVILIGHGVTSNRGIMALTAKSFARNGYAAVAFDFWGHGRSRERFDWSSNPAQIHAWASWARREYPGLPVAYLGHSMGGFAGAEAFHEEPVVDAFVSLGALPRRVPECRTAVAAGVFEELFTIEQARTRLGDKADVISSPFSNHAAETGDPLLILRIIRWVNGALGIDTPVIFPWWLWALSLSGVVIGTTGGLLSAYAVVKLIPKGDGATAAPGVSRRRWSVNPYRVWGLIFGVRGAASPPRSGSLPLALLQGLLFSATTVLLLSLLLDAHIFTIAFSHAGRLVTWLVLTPIAALFVVPDVWALERLPLKSARSRFAVAALTRATPLLLLAAVLRLLYFGLAFLSMMLGIYAFVLVMLALVHATATRAASDWRAGAFASAIMFAWVVAFWFPLYWPWT